MAERTKPINAGETAPDFTLKDQYGKDFTLSKQKGKRVLLSFQPLAWTSICVNQMKTLEENYEKITSLNTLPVGLGVDTIPSKKAWSDHMGLKNLRMLSDFWPHGAVAMLYGIFREEGGTSQRANIIVDEQGKVAWVKVYEMGQLPDINEVLAVLKKMATIR
jgi:peroxiredoxin